MRVFSLFSGIGGFRFGGEMVRAYNSGGMRD